MTTVTGLGKRYRANWALRDCGFELKRGRVTALVGANGAGKTTLLTLLAGLMPPDEGTVHSEGRVRFVAQDKPLYKRFTVAEMLMQAEQLNNVWDQRKAERWLRMFNVPLDRQCGRLSSGQHAQVAFAAALGAVPDVLLLDEPLANLDPLVRKKVMAELLDEVADGKMSLVLSTHVVGELSGVADEILLLSRGHLVLDGELDELMTQHLYYVGPRSDEPPSGEVVQARHRQQQSTFLVRDQSAADLDGPWITRPVSVEDLVLAYLDREDAK
ncbi:ABC-2 type transport system ATP-binding protein [Kibdelosporangium banguiense]|uniref:ABC-2 type transport system ATP-binding protein n=1 Tax=Kibdelosporangium banguiense TaxID=1365924 RepID=A0ABS4T6D4_9PSEU|nr:ABC transporter ATP-binding protein [Kibdelosporangium banguiense]MBP2319990.1 ABC-2 type transport system ATP-binding protein [Kibdelosporangium banguiense]